MLHVSEELGTKDRHALDMPWETLLPRNGSGAALGERCRLQPGPPWSYRQPQQEETP